MILAGFTHEPVIALSEALTRLAPRRAHALLLRGQRLLRRRSGAEDELSLLAQRRAQPAKRRFITLSNSYHGETLGALAVGDVELYKSTYQPLLMDVITVPSPDCYEREPGESWADHSRRQFALMEAALAQHAHEAAAVIVEPLVQCAGNMRMYDPVYLSLLREACDRHDVHLIADEIAVGFGRTGTMFACEQAGIRPDFMCLSKGLTGGYLPLSAVLTTEAGVCGVLRRVREAQRVPAFAQLHRQSARLRGCARDACASFARTTCIERNRALAAHMGARAQRAGGSSSRRGSAPDGHDRRHRDGAGPARLASRTPGRSAAACASIGTRWSAACCCGPIGNVVYFMPPYVITPDEIDLMVDVAREGIELATCE